MIPRYELSLMDIHPFVRHVQLLNIRPSEYPAFTRSYDCRLFYVYRGEGTVFIEDRAYSVSNGRMVLWQPNVDYRMETGEGGMQFLCVNFDYTQHFRDRDYPIPPDRTDFFALKDATELIHFADAEMLDGPIFLSSMQAIEDELLEMRREYTARKLFWRERLSGLMGSVLSNVARGLALSQSEITGDSSLVDQVIAYVQAHSSKALTNADLGRQFSYHPNYLNKQMLLSTGKTLHQYLIACRIARAIELLETTDIPITEIAEMTGAGNISHFSKLFKQKTGNNPSFYRRPR